MLGGTPDEPATTPPAGLPLDSWMRSAWLELAVQVPFEELTIARVSSQALSPAGGERLLSDGEPLFMGPGEVGTHVITATLERHGGGVSRHSWLVEVPDRAYSPEGLWEMPAVEASLQTTAGSAAGIRGHGCYVQGCQEVGFRPPISTIEPLSIAVGETPRLALDDDSALAAWAGTLEAQAGTLSEDVRAEASFPDEPRAGPALAGLAPVAPGEWLLELRVDYDRDRGWQWYLFRLMAE